jgi:hypothetical protein
VGRYIEKRSLRHENPKIFCMHSHDFCRSGWSRPRDRPRIRFPPRLHRASQRFGPEIESDFSRHEPKSIERAATAAVAFQGDNRGDQWPGSRVISAQKANTANAFSLNKLALSTANLFSAVQPGGSLFGLQESNPVNTAVAYGGDSHLLPIRLLAARSAASTSSAVVLLFTTAAGRSSADQA